MLPLLLMWMWSLEQTLLNAAEVMEGPPLKRRKTRSDLAEANPRVAPRPVKVSRRPPKSPRDDGGRSVRPRPLHINDKVLPLAPCIQVMHGENVMHGCHLS